MLSVVIPLYNKASTIERAVRSVLNQTVSDFELIVVNNGSSDGGENIVRSIDDPRVRLVEQDNQGVSMARNRGINEARSEWIAFLDADDEWYPTFLETVSGLHEKYPDCAVCATAYRRCNRRGEIQDIRLYGCPESNDFKMDNYFEVAALSDPPFCSISVMVKKEAIQAIGGFPQGIHQGEDLLTWARLAANNGIAYCRTPQSIFYTGESSAMDKPKRITSDVDIVGKTLEQIHQSNPQLAGLKQYIAHWHKMRASIYLRLSGYASQCRKEIRISRRWHKNKKTVYYMILSYIPYTLRMKIMTIFNH